MKLSFLEFVPPYMDQIDTYRMNRGMGWLAGRPSSRESWSDLEPVDTTSRCVGVRIVWEAKRTLYSSDL